MATRSALARPITAPPNQDSHSSQHRKYGTTDVPPMPKLRRKRSTIGRDTDGQPQGSYPVPPQAKTENLNPPISRPVSSKRYSDPKTPLAEEPPTSQNSSSPQHVHPALRDKARQENRLSATPFSYAPSTTPSTRYTASPAFSQVSSRTSVSSYSPNMPSAPFGASTTDRKDDRRGPPLPASPKAFKEAATEAARLNTRPVSTESRAPPAIPPEFAHLNIDVESQPNFRSRPRRPSRDGTPDLSDLSGPIPVIHSELSPRPSSGEHFISPTSPASEGRRRFFGLRSRSSSRDSKYRKDSGVYPLTPTNPDFAGSEARAPSKAMHPTTPSPANEDISRPGSASRFGRLLARSKDGTKSQKTLRKGPAAGTGHEGYGKFGFRGRNFSFSSLKSAGRSRSVDSTTSQDSSRPNSRRSSGDDEHSESDAEFDGSGPYGNNSSVVARADTPSMDKRAFVQSGLLGKKHLDNTQGASFAQRATRGQDLPVDILNQFETTSYIGVGPKALPEDRQTHRSSRRLSMGNTGKREPAEEDQERPKSSRKWNFFQRAQAKQKTAQQSTPSRSDSMANDKKLGYYAAASQELPIDLQEAQGLISDKRVSGHSHAGEAQTQPIVPYDDGRHSSLMPPPPLLSSEQAKQRSQNRRPSSFRLDSSESPEILHATVAQSARTPTVVNSPRTISRGFPERQPMPGNAFALGIENLSSTIQSTLPVDTTPSDEQFIAFPERKNSELSYTSSSAGASFHSTSTLVGNAPPHTWLGDEDVWNEYNDFIDEVLPAKAQTSNTPKTPPSASSSFSAPFQYDDTRGPHRPDSRFLPQIHALIEDLEAPPAPQENLQSSSPDRFSQYLQPATAPSTPYSLSDIMAGYGERTASYASTKARQSGYGDPRHSVESGYSSQYSRMSGPSRPMSRPDAGETVSPVMEEPEPLSAITEASSRKSRRSADADLRFGALMTSKWLSFGRVLFSPAHNEVRSGEDVRVLVVDGLGKDWSYYCALTYPSATFYNLEVTSNEAKSSNRGQDLSNYRNVRHSSIGSPFPFPRGFFTAVIFRFPIAATDKAYHACIFECKRVLRPGGFLELSVLDLDMMNMGTNARRALRSLKIDMHGRNDQISLRNLGDTMLTLIGRRGFDNIQRCVVGIPVAGRIPRSQDMSSDSSGRSSLQAAISAHDRGERKTKDFAGILYSQQSSSPTKARDNDEGITKMVAKVGRWWYSTCYSTAAVSENTMWEQPGLLRECEKQGTAFKLLLCYAQKPTCPPRRTASV
ncbi:hypothetical protein C1H76_0270 [Elsinoe australis]|uniref:Methyltransferase type 11 domain-containing protein n=1 Tax=Elsinoe australis TaxID=40998 RepID=A0A4U7B7G4_9PEZI|nr:hypothetical protein C1H76_0270 [Elsinoe australis]